MIGYWEGGYWVAVFCCCLVFVLYGSGIFLNNHGGLAIQFFVPSPNLDRSAGYRDGVNAQESSVIKRDHYVRVWLRHSCSPGLPSGEAFVSTWLQAVGSGEPLSPVRLEGSQRKLCAAALLHAALDPLALWGSSVRPPHRHTVTHMFFQAPVKSPLSRVWESLLFHILVYTGYDQTWCQ